DSPVLPAVRRTVTFTFADGAADSDTPNTSLVPRATGNCAGATISPPAAAEVPAVAGAPAWPAALAALVASPAQPSDAAATNTALRQRRGRRGVARKGGLMVVVLG